MVHSTWGESGAYWWGEARNVYFMYADDTTGIDEIANTKNNNIVKSYNLMGQEVSGNTKGLLVRDGKKLFVK
jgi:hypothetical protein